MLTLASICKKLNEALLIWIERPNRATVSIRNQRSMNMIPRILQLKNFLSYGSDFQTIDFRPHHLIYLSGRNGHGKSALLDAITWAVWGQARKVTNAVRADQGLLRLGQTQMAVIFDFEVNGNVYRIKREFLVSHNKPLAQLEFGVFDTVSEKFIPLTDKTIRATQDKIEQTIKLDYDSFVNTAFLRQGNANEFSKKSPKDRKDILGTILGLQQFDTLKRRALEKIKQLHALRTTLEALIESLEKQGEHKQEIEASLSAIESEKKEIENRALEIARHKKEYDSNLSTYSDMQKSCAMTEFSIKEAEKNIEQDMHRVKTDIAKWRSINAMQRSKDSFEAIEQMRLDVKKRISVIDACIKKRLELQQSLLQLNVELQKATNILESDCMKKEQALCVTLERITLELENSKKQKSLLTAEHDDVSKSIRALQLEIEEVKKIVISHDKFEAISKQFEKRKEFYHQYVAQKNMQQAIKAELIQKQSMVHDENPSCPLCEQNLSAARKKFLKTKCLKQLQTVQWQHDRLTRIIPKLKELLINQHTFLESQKKERECQAMLEKQHAELLKKESACREKIVASEMLIQKNDQEKREAEKRLKEWSVEKKAMISQDSHIVALSMQITESQKIFAELRYDTNEHEKLMRESEEIEQKKQALFVLQQDIVQQHDRQQSISEQISALKKLKKHRDALKQNSLSYNELEKQKIVVDASEKALAEKTKSYNEARELLREKMGILLQKKEHIAKIEEECNRHRIEQKKIISEIELYLEISAAAGKDGIQALLIEDAIPEIESEANRLLSRLTHNQCHILIESLRDLKRGGAKETLDINISDPSGIRPYELFSGGEAFRIDLALRLAISKLLARRAGTSLQTLIIDEGFGSQDEEGLSLIMDALYAIQEDFEKVIVVSHLPSMRDQFPVHFTVEKGPSGSRVSVMEQG